MLKVKILLPLIYLPKAFKNKSVHISYCMTLLVCDAYETLSTRCYFECSSYLVPV